MSADYTTKVKSGRLVLKGEKRSHKKHKSKKRKHDEDSKESKELLDTSNYGGWWQVSRYGEVSGSIAIQIGNLPMYMKALDQGFFTVGAPHDEGDGPAPEEIFTTVPAGSNQVALKSGYGKYLGVDSDGRVTGVADAIGPREHWEPIFEDGKTALLAPNGCFLGLDDEDNVVATNSKAEEEQMIVLRANATRLFEKTDPSAQLDKGKLKDIELGYVKMFQKFQDKKIKINKEGRAELKDAKSGGKLHEGLLDRRSKMKADRYCK